METTKVQTTRREYQKAWYAKTKLQKQLNKESEKPKKSTKKPIADIKFQSLEDKLDKLLQKLSDTSGFDPKFGELIMEMDAVQFKLDNLKKSK